MIDKSPRMAFLSDVLDDSPCQFMFSGHVEQLEFER
jgi:hypothetical protein